MRKQWRVSQSMIFQILRLAIHETYKGDETFSCRVECLPIMQHPGCEVFSPHSPFFIHMVGACVGQVDFSVVSMLSIEQHGLRRNAFDVDCGCNLSNHCCLMFRH